MDNDSSQRSIFTARISWRRLGCLGCKPAVWRWATLWRKITSRGVQLIPVPQIRHWTRRTRIPLGRRHGLQKLGSNVQISANKRSYEGGWSRR
jgi:hypothetical protein